MRTEHLFYGTANMLSLKGLMQTIVFMKFMVDVFLQNVMKTESHWSEDKGLFCFV